MNESLGDRLRRARELLGYAQKGMAKAVGCGLRSWQDYEGDKKAPGSQVITGCAHLGINTNWLLTGEGPMLLKNLVNSDSERDEKRLAEVVSRSVQIAINQLDREANHRLQVADDAAEYQLPELPQKDDGQETRDLTDSYITELRESGRDFFSKWRALLDTGDTELQSAIMRELVGKSIAHELVSSQFEHPLRKAKPPKQEKKVYGGIKKIELKRTGNDNE